MITLNKKLMMWPTSDLIKAEWRRQNKMVEAICVYYDVLEAVNYVEEDIIMENTLVTIAITLSNIMLIQGKQTASISSITPITKIWCIIFKTGI
ncbi:hypothetical protein DPV78_000260 [Talaromyces pinophilus]|nr:hypothetical protein DPV78_000260 [Talaromyces pinophilus]